jgi:hypothetical protein
MVFIGPKKDRSGFGSPFIDFTFGVQPQSHFKFGVALKGFEVGGQEWPSGAQQYV